MFNGTGQLLEDITFLLDDGRKPIKTPFRLFGMPLLKVLQPIPLKLFLLFGRSDHVDLRPISIRIVISVQTDHWPGSVIDLALQQVPGRLNLTSLIPTFHRTDDPALVLDFAKLFQNRLFHSLTYHLHTRRTLQRVHDMFK